MNKALQWRASVACVDFIQYGNSFLHKVYFLHASVLRWYVGDALEVIYREGEFLFVFKEAQCGREASFM